MPRPIVISDSSDDENAKQAQQTSVLPEKSSPNFSRSLEITQVPENDDEPPETTIGSENCEKQSEKTTTKPFELVNFIPGASVYRPRRLHTKYISDDSENDEQPQSNKEIGTNLVETGKSLEPHEERLGSHFQHKESMYNRLPSRGRINRKFVSNPSKILGGDTPQRPYPDKLCRTNIEKCGSANEILKIIFPARTRPDHCPWYDGDFSAPVFLFQKLEEKRQVTLRSYTGLPEDDRRRQRKMETLEKLQDLLWILHYQKPDKKLENTLRLMIQKFSCRFDQNQRLKFINKCDFSLIWNRSIGSENSSILSQRKTGYKLRPVYIDGLSFLDIFYPTTSSLHIIHTRILLEILLHFILDGHKTVLFLPSYYQEDTDKKVDDPSAFHFLCNIKLLELVEEPNRKAVEQRVLDEAEKGHGIIVSTSEELAVHYSIQCFPTVNIYSHRIDEFLLSTFFERNARLDSRFEKEVDRKTRKRFRKVMGIDSNSSESEADSKTREYNIDPESSNESFERPENLKCINFLEPHCNFGVYEQCEELRSETRHDEQNIAMEKKEHFIQGASVCCDSFKNQKNSPGAAKLPTLAVDSGVVLVQSNENMDSECDSGNSERSESSDCSDYDEIKDSENYQDFAQNCRLYSYSERLKIDTSRYQLTLERQVFLISSFIQLATFHFQRHQQVRVFILTIQRFMPDLLPVFMQKSIIEDVEKAMQNIRNGQDPENWPIFWKPENNL